MIKNRPKHLLAQKSYTEFPNLPMKVMMDAVPELTNLSLLDIGGIQPVTAQMAQAAGGVLFDQPCSAEVSMYKKADAKFQMISVVASVVLDRVEKDHISVKPFGLTLIPASKRGEVHEVSVDLIDKFKIDELLEGKPTYHNYNPFSGHWSCYGLGMPLGKINSGQCEGFIDELGIVINQFFLTTEYHEQDVLVCGSEMPNQELNQKYKAHRCKLLFRPFRKVYARRIWGAESPIELFVLQELSRRGVYPELQIMIMPDGKTFSTLYNYWQALDNDEAEHVITEVDLYFPTQQVAVFCDGGHHNRKKQREKDKKIDKKLRAIGIEPIRFSGKRIIEELSEVCDEIEDTLKKRTR